MEFENGTHILEGTSEVFEGTDITFDSETGFQAHRYVAEALYTRGQGNFALVRRPNPMGESQEESQRSVVEERPVDARVFNNEPELLHVNTFLELGSELAPSLDHLMKMKISEKLFSQSERARVARQIADNLITQRIGSTVIVQR